MSTKRMRPVSKFCFDLLWVVVLLFLTPGIRANGNLDNFTVRQRAGVNPSTGNMASTAPEVLLSYQLPSETRGTDRSEERTGWSRGQAGVKISQSPNDHQQSEQTQGQRCAHFNPAQQRGPNNLGVMLEALTGPGSLLMTSPMPCPNNYTGDPFHTNARGSGHDAGTIQRFSFSGVETPEGHRDKTSQRHIKSHRLVAAKIISERTTVYPFIDAAKAMDYLSNYDTQPRPKRWPLRILLTEAEQRNVESRKNLAKYSAGQAGSRAGSALAGILGTVTELLLRSFRYNKRLKRQAAFESDQAISAPATLSNSGGEIFPTGHAIYPNANPPDALSVGESSIHQIRVTNTPYSVIQKDELSSNVTPDNKRVTDNTTIPRRDRKRRKGIRSRGVIDTNCDGGLKNVSRISRAKERHRTKKLNKDGDRHEVVNLENSSEKPNEKASISPCDGHKKKTRKNRFYKIHGKSSTTAREGFNTTTPKGSSTMVHEDPSITARKGSSASASPAHVTSISWQQLGKKTTAETQNTGIFPDNRAAADTESTTRISLESELLKTTTNLTDFHPVQRGNVTEYFSPKSDGTDVWTTVSLLADNSSDITRMTSTSPPPRPASEWNSHLRQQRRRGSLDTVDVETTASHTHFHTGSAKPVTQTLPSTNEPMSMTFKEATTTTSYTTKYKSAYDFLSAQQGLRRDPPNNARKEAEAFNLRLATNLCKVFGKRYVPTPIGGKCE